MATMRNSDRQILNVFHQHFAPDEFSIEIQNSIAHDATLIRVGYWIQSSSMQAKKYFLDTNVLGLYDSSSSFTKVLEASAQNVARQVYTHLLKQEPLRTSRLDPDPFDPDAIAINALIQLVGGSIIGRNTPVLVPGELNPWMLNLPAQEKIIPLKGAYFQKPLDWWQRFITFHVGE